MGTDDDAKKVVCQKITELIEKGAGPLYAVEFVSKSSYAVLLQLDTTELLYESYRNWVMVKEDWLDRRK